MEQEDELFDNQTEAIDTDGELKVSYHFLKIS